jgi:hypothetical protein
MALAILTQFKVMQLKPALRLLVNAPLKKIEWLWRHGTGINGAETTTVSSEPR